MECDLQCLFRPSSEFAPRLEQRAERADGMENSSAAFCIATRNESAVDFLDRWSRTQISGLPALGTWIPTSDGRLVEQGVDEWANECQSVVERVPYREQ